MAHVGSIFSLKKTSHFWAYSKEIHESVSLAGQYVVWFFEKDVIVLVSKIYSGNKHHTSCMYVFLSSRGLVYFECALDQTSTLFNKLEFVC
jgi:hypothetical protein